MKNIHHFAKLETRRSLSSRLGSCSCWQCFLLAAIPVSHRTTSQRMHQRKVKNYLIIQDRKTIKLRNTVRRQQWVQQFDLDTNGFLDVSEREAMRKTPQTRGKSFRRGKGGANEEGKRAFALMPRIIGSRNTTRMEMEAFRAKSLKKGIGVKGNDSLICMIAMATKPCHRLR